MLKKCFWFGWILLISFFCLDLDAQAYQFPDRQGSKVSRKVTVFEGDLSLKSCNSRIFYYRFHKGDKIEVTAKLKKGKKLKSFRIFQYPDFEKYLTTDAEEPIKYQFQISETGVYGFEIIGANCLGSKRKLNFKVERQPLDDSLLNFNTNVTFRTVIDSNYHTEYRDFLVRRDSNVIAISDQLIKISSQNALNGNTNRRSTTIQLPEGTVSWSYYIGVGQQAAAEYDNQIKSHLNKLAAGYASIDPMTALLIYGVNRFLKVNSGDNVRFWVSNFPGAGEQFNLNGTFVNDPLTLHKTGDVINDASQLTKPLQGKVSFLMLNDNIIDPIEVRLVVKSLVVKAVYEKREIRVLTTKPRKIPENSAF